MNGRWIVIFVLLLLLALPAAAQAQSYGCTPGNVTNGFWVDCGPRAAVPAAPYACQQTKRSGGWRVDCVARAPTATATLLPTLLPTPPPSPTLLPTALPTAISTLVPTPIVTPAPPPLSLPVVNVPMLPVASGSPQLDANGRAIISFGNVSLNGAYTDLRLVGATDGLRLRLATYDQSVVPGDAVTVTIGTQAFTAAWGVPGLWALDNRCITVCRGWTAELRLSWADLGGVPVLGATLPLVVTSTDVDAGSAQAVTAHWVGTLRWGLPDYAAGNLTGANVLTLPLIADASVGGQSRLRYRRAPE